MLEKGHTWKVLDKGYVKFIGSMGADEEIVEAARMSTGRGFVSWEAYRRCEVCDEVELVTEKAVTTECIGEGRLRDSSPHKWQPFDRGDFGFLDYLYMNKHATPFEMCSLSIEVKAPIFVLREWQRHRVQKYNEFSARYAQMPNEHYIPELNRIVKQSKTNRQASSAEAFPRDIAAQITAEIERQQIEIYETYDSWIDNGLANEVARINTPGSRYSKMRAKTDLRNWLGFLILRKQSRHSKPQWEIAQYADVIGEIIKILFPRTYELFEEHTLYSETFSRTEMKLLRQVFNKLALEAGQGELHGLPPGFEKRTYKSVMGKLKEG